MKVIIINEDNHGTLGIAENYTRAIDFLFMYDWIQAGTEIYNYDTKEWTNIEELLGDNWINVIRAYTIDEFNNTFDAVFRLEEMLVY